MSLIVNEKLIETPIPELLISLQNELALKHSHRLQYIDYKQQNARITCPFHADGKERTPSCEILIEDKEDTKAGTVYCFGCGYKASFLKFVADCLDISYRNAANWILDNSTYSLLDTYRDIKLIDIDELFGKKPEVKTVSEEELASYRYYHPYMTQRKLTDEVIQKFDVGYDKELDALTFPVYVKGKCLFVAKRRVSFKRFDMPTMKNKPIYGLDYVKGKTVIVCESIINALTCYAYGREAIALFGTGSDNNYKELANTDIRHFILMFDGDNAGRAGAERFKKHIHNAFVTDIIMPQGKDVNDLTKEEFDKLLEQSDTFL